MVLLIFFCLLIFDFVKWSLSEPKFIGDFTGFQHGVRGSLFKKDDNTMVINNFYYDGQGPSGDLNVFFYIVNSSYPYSPEDVKRGYKNSQGFKIFLPFPSNGQFYEYEDQNIPDLRTFFNELKINQNVRYRKGNLYNSINFRNSNSCSDVQWPEFMELSLPESIGVNDITFLSVWCRTLGVNFGHVEFPLKKTLYDKK